MSDEHPHGGDGGELPPWLRDDPTPEVEKPSGNAGSQLPVSPGQPAPQPSPEDEAVPPWLRENQPARSANFGEDDWLAGADLLPQSLDTEQTYDDWAAIQKELQREKGIEEEIPDLSASLLDETPAAPKQTGPLGKTGELPDWFLGLEELDTSDAPDWFTGESASAFLSNPEEGLPPSDEPAVRPKSITSFFESLHEAPVYDEPDPNNPFAIAGTPSGADEEELPSLDWISAQPYEPQVSPDDSYSGTEMDAFFRSLTNSTARVVTGELKPPPDQLFEEPPQESTQPIEAVVSGDAPVEELPDVDWFSAVGVVNSAADFEEPELDLIMSDSSDNTQLPETRFDLEMPPEETVEDAPVSGETLEWLSELEGIVTSVNRPMDDEEVLPATPDFSTLEAFGLGSEDISENQLAEVPVYDWESAAEAAIPDPEEVQDAEIIINPEGVADIKTDWLRAIDPATMEAAEAAAATLPDAPQEPAWESPLPPVEPKIKLTGMLTRAGIHEAPEEPEPEPLPTASGDLDSEFFGDLSWDEVVNKPSAADQIPEPPNFGEDTLESVLLAETLMGGDSLESGFETADTWGEQTEAEWSDEEPAAAPDLDWLGSMQAEPGTIQAEPNEAETFEAATVEAEPDSNEMDWLATMQAEGDLTVDTPALAQEANADLAAFERALFGGTNQPDYATNEEEIGWMSDEMFGDAETSAAESAQALESLGLQGFDVGEPDGQFTVDQNAASEFERELAELDLSELESEADDLFADSLTGEALTTDFDLAGFEGGLADEAIVAAEFEPDSFGVAATETAAPDFDLDLSEFAAQPEDLFATAASEIPQTGFELDFSDAGIGAGALIAASLMDDAESERAAPDFELDLSEFEGESAEFELDSFGAVAADTATPDFELDLTGLETSPDELFAASLTGEEPDMDFELAAFAVAHDLAAPESELDLAAFEGEPAGESGTFEASEAAAEADFQFGLEGTGDDGTPDFFAVSEAGEFEIEESGFEVAASPDLLDSSQGEIALEAFVLDEIAGDALAFEQPEGEFATWEAEAVEEPEAFTAPDFVDHETALSEDDDDDRIDDEQFYPEIEALAVESTGDFEGEQPLSEEKVSDDDLNGAWLAGAAVLGVAAVAAADAPEADVEIGEPENGDGFVIHFGGDAFAYASAEEGLEADEASPTLEELESGDVVFESEDSEDDFFRDFGMAQDESAAEQASEPLPYDEGIPGSFSWEVNTQDAQTSAYEDVEAAADEALPEFESEPEFVADLDEQGWVAEVPESVGEEAQYEDLDSYLKTLTISTGTLKPLTDSLLEPDADLESLLEQKVTEDAPAPQGYNPYSTASPFDVSDDPELADLAATETPEWLSDVSVGEVSATAIVRKQQDRSESDLDDRLKKLRSRAEKIPQQPTGTETDSLETVLPGVGSAIAPARIGMSSTEVSGVALTPDQQGNVTMLTSLVATATDTAPTGAKQPSAIDQTYESSYNLNFDDEQAARGTNTPAKTTTRKGKTKSRSRIRVDRLLIALLVLVVIALPFFIREARVGDPPPETFADDPQSIAAFDTIENLAPGSVVLVGAEYAPASAAELDLALGGLLRHILMRGAYPVVISSNPLGLLRAELLLDDIASDSDFLEQIGVSELQPNADYFLVQFLPGGAIGLRAFSEDTANLVQNDIRGQVTGLNLNTLRDFAAVAVVSDRLDDVRAYVEQIAPLTQSPVIALVNYGAAPMVEPYVDELPDGMLAGLITGYEGAYTYNTLIGNFPDPESGLAALLIPETTDEAEATDEVEGTPLPTSAAQIAPRETRPAPLLFTPSATFTPTPTHTLTPTFTFTPTNTLTPTFTPTPVVGRISSSQSVNLRAQPDTTAEILALLQPGSALTVIGQTEDGTWLNVRIDAGIEGWVSSQLVAITGAYSPTDKDTVAKPAGQTRPDETTPTAEFEPAELTVTAQIGSFVQTATAMAAQNASPEPEDTGAVDAETNTPRPTQRVTNTPEPTETNTRRPTIEPSDTPEPTETNTPRPSATPEPTATPTEEATPEVTAEATEQAAPSLSITIAPPSAGYRDERWYAMTLGIIVSAGVIALGAIINVARSITRRRRSR